MNPTTNTKPISTGKSLLTNKITNMKRLILVLLATAFMLQLHAQSEIYAPKGTAINGYDVVAFFHESKPVMGSSEFSHQYKNATWLFSTKENMEAFAAAPQKYAPQYGGWCAYGTSQGHKAPTQVDTWTITNDKLYFNYNKKVKAMWSQDQKHLIEVADEKWPTVKLSKE
jgi:hypothetical protein